MPFHNGTGPWGKGSRTGFGMGFCGGYSQTSPYQYNQQMTPQFSTYWPYSYGPGFGSIHQMNNPYHSFNFSQSLGQRFGLNTELGTGFGYGRGLGLGWGRGFGMGWRRRGAFW